MSDAPVTRPDLDAIGMRATDAEQARDYSGNTSRRRAITNEASAEDVPVLLAALAAERARADQAEQRIAEAPHADDCISLNALREVQWPGLCDCWKSAASTTEQ